MPLPRASRLLPLAGLAALSACSYELHVAVVDTRGGHPRFEMSRSAEDEVRAMPVNELRVVPQVDGEWDYGHPAWCIGLAPGTYLDEAVILYGVVPPGFTECAHAGTLRRGAHYLVVVSGAGVHANTEFAAGE
jgi:hypothetical protein